jgi:hypothetical protein
VRCRAGSASVRELLIGLEPVDSADRHGVGLHWRGKQFDRLGDAGADQEAVPEP